MTTWGYTRVSTIVQDVEVQRRALLAAGVDATHLVHLVDELGRRGVQLRSLTEGLDTTTPSGRLLFHVMAALAEFERDLIRERTAAGLEAARASGKVLGRQSPVTREQYRLILTMAGQGTPQRTIAATCGVPRATVGRIVRGEVPSLTQRFGQDVVDDELPVTTGGI